MGNSLEKLKGDWAGQYSIRINNQRRICFKWSDNKEDMVIASNSKSEIQYGTFDQTMRPLHYSRLACFHFALG